jgi:hypothetical protein
VPEGEHQMFLMMVGEGEGCGKYVLLMVSFCR